MFNRGKQKSGKQDSNLSNILIGIGGLALEVDEIVDVTAQYPWKDRPVKEIRLGRRAEAFRDIVNNKPRMDIGDEIYAYAGGSGLDSRGYFVLVERVGQKASTAPELATSPQTAAQTPTVAAVSPKSEPAPGPAPRPEPSLKQAEPQAPLLDTTTSRFPPAPSAPDTQPSLEMEAARYSQLTLEEYEAMPMFEAAKVPPHVVERLHKVDKRLAPTPQPEALAETGLQQDLLKLLAGDQETGASAEPGGPPDYSRLTLEDYEAMPMSEAAQVPPEVVKRLHRLQQEKEQ